MEDSEASLGKIGVKAFKVVSKIQCQRILKEILLGLLKDYQKFFENFED